MIFAVVPVLALAASAYGLAVTSPTNSSGWSNSGSHTVSWTSVSSDPTNFTIMLVNEAVNPTYSQVLDALVQTSQGSITVNPPSSGWPAPASGFQVNLVQSATDPGILAQSNDFTITQASSSSSSGSSTSSGSLSSSSGTGLTVTPTPTGPTSSSGSSSSSGSGSASPSTSDTSTTPNNANGAAPAMGMQAAVFGFLTLLGVVLV